ncbi:uncharacterized protein LOC123300985 [Chrysoperla carnea]|uniref:uncharacterized protein LOC123300985 n=1 Tax=Chrysoperla carnea TaxID=189513 RepID=UPI001D0957A1|nr:uncharacterized protein LOC123300985 [Chrysoperla carnea]XP_044739620.1 uncharacterized protein LOC123300985 [Chrysoperla carnea]
MFWKEVFLTIATLSVVWSHPHSNKYLESLSSEEHDPQKLQSSEEHFDLNFSATFAKSLVKLYRWSEIETTDIDKDKLIEIIYEKINLSKELCNHRPTTEEKFENAVKNILNGELKKVFVKMFNSEKLIEKVSNGDTEYLENTNIVELRQFSNYLSFMIIIHSFK